QASNRSRQPGVGIELSTQVRQTLPHVVSVVESIGLELDEQIDAWSRQCGVETVKLWLSKNTKPAEIVHSWLSIMNEQLPALAALTIEARLSGLGAEVGSYFRSNGSSYSAAIVNSRWS